MDLEDEISGMDMLSLDRAYGSQEEFLRDVSSWLDLALYYYYIRHQWLGPGSELKNMLGLVVSREEFEHHLGKASRKGLWAQLGSEEKSRLSQTEEAIRRRLSLGGGDFPLLRVREEFDMDGFAFKCLLLSFMPTADAKYERIFSYLQDDIGKKSAGTGLATELFLPEGEDILDFSSYFHRKKDFLSLFKEDRLREGQLVPKEMVLDYLCDGRISEDRGLEFYDGSTKDPAERLLAGGETARMLDRLMGSPESCCIFLSGQSGSGKRFQIRHALSRFSARGVFADLSGDGFEEMAARGMLAARLSGACLILYNLEREDESGKPVPPSPHMLSYLESLLPEAAHRNTAAGFKCFFLSSIPLKAFFRRLVIEIDMPPLSEADRLEMFRALLEPGVLEDCTVEELAAKFHFSPRQISAACLMARGLSKLENGDGRISGKMMHRCCYRQAVHRLGELAALVPPGGSWDDVVLPQEKIRLMRQACLHVRYRHRVYGEWGFDEKVSYGKGLSILFAGPPGTGKTMCARLIARELDMEMYRVNISQVVSKYIGETEKNLREVFLEARRADCVLFFDECDALFGKRSEVKDSHDRNANMETAYLLQQIEEYDGICILASNLIGNIDAAFMRRMSYVIHFPFPDAMARERIFRRLIPESAPRSSDIDWSFLAEKFEISGGHIKNIVLSAAFMAAGEQAPLSMKHLLKASINELRKNEIVVVREQLREYSDYLDME